MDFLIILVLRYVLFTVAFFLLGTLMHYFFDEETVYLKDAKYLDKRAHEEHL